MLKQVDLGYVHQAWMEMPQPLSVTCSRYDHPHSKEREKKEIIFLLSDGIPSISICTPCLLSFCWAQLGRVCLHYCLPAVVYPYWWDQPWAFSRLYSPWNLSLEIRLKIHQIFQLFYHLWGVCWLVSVHVLHIPGSPGLTQLCRAEWRGRITLSLLVMLFLVQPMMLLPTLSVRAHTSCLSEPWCSLCKPAFQLIRLQHGVNHTRCRTWNSPLLSFMRFLPAYSPASPGPSGWQHTHLVYQLLLPVFYYQPACWRVSPTIQVIVKMLNGVDPSTDPWSTPLVMGL